MEYRLIGRWLESQGVPTWFIVLVLDPLLIFLGVFLCRELLLWFLQRGEATRKRLDLWTQISFYCGILLGIVLVGFEWRMAGLHWIGESLKLEMDSHHVRLNLEGAANALVSTALLVFVLVLISRAYRFVVSRLCSWEETAGAIRFQRAILLTPTRIRQTASLALKVFRLVLVVCLFYVYVPLLLSYFPLTAPFAGQIMPYVISPFKQIGSATLNYIPRFVTLVLIIVVMRYLLRFLNFVFAALDKREIRLPGFDPQWATSTYHLVRILVVLITLIIGYPYLPGSETAVFKGFSVFVGAMVTLGGSASINHLISGFALTYGGVLQVGDKVQVGDKLLDVLDKGLMVTRFRNLKNEELSITNSAILAEGVVNLSAAVKERGLAIKITAGIGYDVDWRQVHSLMIEAAGKTPGILADPVPFVLEKNLANYAVNYELYAFTDQVQRFARLSAELHREVLDAFNQAGVEIMTPAVNALRDANQPAIPGTYTPDPLEVRGIRVEKIGN